MIKNRYTIADQGLLHFEQKSMTTKETMNWLENHGQELYTCLRGPRPSAALIDLSRSMGRIFVLGQVAPTEGTHSCKQAGECMIEDGHCVRNNHAEVDALLRCARAGIATQMATIYSINKPCYQCTRAIIAAGIRRIYYRYAVYDEQRTTSALHAAGVEVFKI